MPRSSSYSSTCCSADACETLRLLRKRSRPVGARSVGRLTKLLEPTFNGAQFEQHFLQWEYDTNRYEKDNAAVLRDGVEIAILLNKTSGALWQQLQLRSEQVTNYSQTRAVILDYYKTISAFSRSTSAVGANCIGRPAPMIWRQGRNYKGKRKGNGSKGKGKCRNKGCRNGFDKGNTGSCNKGGCDKGRGKGYSVSKGLWIKKRLQRQRSLRQLYDMPQMWQGA